MSTDKRDIDMLVMYIHQDSQFAKYIVEENERLKDENARMAQAICEDRNLRMHMYDRMKELEMKIWKMGQAGIKEVK